MIQRRRSRTGGIEPPAREAGWKAGAPSPGQPAGTSLMRYRFDNNALAKGRAAILTRIGPAGHRPFQIDATIEGASSSDRASKS
jgi:hypothetical protein